MSGRKSEQERVAERWNASYPSGTPVRFWTGFHEGPGEVSRTRSAAQMLGTEPSRNYPGHTAVVWVDANPSAIALTHVEPITDEPLVVISGGRRYHREGCRAREHGRDTFWDWDYDEYGPRPPRTPVYKVTAHEASLRGKTPCRVCFRNALAVAS